MDDMMMMMMIMHQVVNPPKQKQKNSKGPVTLGFKQYRNTMNNDLLSSTSKSAYQGQGQTST